MLLENKNIQRIFTSCAGECTPTNTHLCMPHPPVSHGTISVLSPKSESFPLQLCTLVRTFLTCLLVLWPAAAIINPAEALETPHALVDLARLLMRHNIVIHDSGHTSLDRVGLLSCINPSQLRPQRSYTGLVLRSYPVSTRV